MTAAWLSLSRLPDQDALKWPVRVEAVPTECAEVVCSLCAAVLIGDDEATFDLIRLMARVAAHVAVCPRP